MFSLLRENTKIAFSSIKTQLLRTILTVIIIGVGIWALVGILATVKVLENTITGNFSAMGTNTFSISRYDFSQQIRQNDRTAKVNPNITYPQAKSFQDKYHFPASAVSLSFTAASDIEVKYGSEKTDPEISVLGVDHNFMGNSGLETTSGRNFTTFDIQNNNYVCIVGSDFEKGLLKDVNPIGKTISIRGARFKVIGVLKEQGSTFGNRQDLRVLLPIQVARSLFTAPNINYDIKVKTQNKDMLDGSIDEATITMRRVRKLNPVEENNFGIARSDELLQRLMSQINILNYAAWCIGIITVFGSTIALMNIMLVSVTERTREIGVRKSLGAKKNTIAGQFLTETLIISFLGGLLGIVLGLLTGYGASLLMKTAFPMPWGATMAALTTIIVVTIISGAYPAVKAASLDPVESLRYE
ncbi:FtsX-like permease family protein [Flavobacterium rakeshii]|uniref:FtsX-like permease family protein n=1 Tax=Flavobacterium rakeshii TaxID=1038845 RepID=A0A6N8HA12_9FLAO|nr:ABC transporter permease [Flavobacterium rakeshii]MEE1897056.1 ABC transporter permease [Flavobacterium rakeshii]MUV03142.1 FtsX-like permease family protein [Flavobacterium rakeshii]